jgi:hypothetical protein
MGMGISVRTFQLAKQRVLKWAYPSAHFSCRTA